MNNLDDEQQKKVFKIVFEEIVKNNPALNNVLFVKDDDSLETIKKRFHDFDNKDETNYMDKFFSCLIILSLIVLIFSSTGYIVSYVTMVTQGLDFNLITFVFASILFGSILLLCAGFIFVPKNKSTKLREAIGQEIDEKV